ncbi:PepSY domain-containing protein [Streptomyces ochraceiscleroticus]|uniref:PepSY domain-containing protein n=1 Tax=Streptomyces ochraceiscleroticus TaxID=47761 RepID=A0ABW1MCY7_9ACTN|nr:PepSY domain-containing protein [Streptomyces ochraceiscleroticus]
MKRNVVIATVAAAALIAGGTATAVAIGSEDGTAAASSSSPAQGQQAEGVASYENAQGQGGDNDGDDAREAKAASVTAQQAAAAALKAVPGTVTEADLDDDESGVAWDVNVLGKDGKWHDITVGADKAEVRSQHVDQDDDGDEGKDRVRSVLNDASVDIAQAAGKAAAHGTVVSVELDGPDHGKKLAWEAETVTKDGAEHHVTVDPGSGAVSNAPSDDDNDGDDD